MKFSLLKICWEIFRCYGLLHVRSSNMNVAVSSANT